MKYDEVSNIIDGSNLVGYGRFNPDHITAVEQFKTMEKKWNTYRECINQILQLLLNGKSFVCLRDIYQIFLAHLRILKNLMKKNYLLKTKTYFFYIIYTFILILNSTFKTGFYSVGLDVEDIHEELENFRKNNVEIAMEATRISVGMMARVIDPNGVNIVLIQHDEKE